MTWTTICHSKTLVPDRGAAVLVDGREIAIFLLSDGSLHAVDHRDPTNGAPVMARGLVGSLGSTSYVASPLLKERYDLNSGNRVDLDPDAGPAPELATYAVREHEGFIEIQAG